MSLCSKKTEVSRSKCPCAPETDEIARLCSKSEQDRVSVLQYEKNCACALEKDGLRGLGSHDD